jgi:hypothetical protein
MYEVLCEHCWHTLAVDDDHLPDDQPCPGCGSAGSWVGPFAEEPQRFTRRDGWQVLTSPLYLHAGLTDRRARPR